jgi:capsular exopolysaccharide synthesis family protein
MTVNLTNALMALVRWWWLLLTAAGMAGLMTYHAVRQAPPVYVSTTTLLVGEVLRSPKPGEDEFSVAQNLANGYAALAVRQPVLDATVKALNLPYVWEVLRQRIVVVHPTGSLTVEIRAMDPDPVVARDIAATIADQIIAASPTRDRKVEVDRRMQFLKDELADLQARIEQGRADLVKKQTALSQETNARGVLDRQDEIKAIELNLTKWRTSYSELLASLEGRGDPNTLTILEPALVPTTPAGPRGIWYVLLSAVGGFGVVAVGIVALELLSGKVRSRNDLPVALVDEPGGIVAYIPTLGKSEGPIAVVADPTSRAADSYRLLAAQLRFGEPDEDGSTVLMITSATNREGKSTTAANLAAALALGGSSVLLIDLDLRKPTLHTLFDVPNQGGAADMLRYRDFNPEHLAVKTRVPRLWLLPAGVPSDNPTELLSKSARPLILSAWSTADFVIIDGPPLLAAADASVLTGFVPDTLFVTRFDQSSAKDVRSALELLSRQRTTLRGVVMNGVPDAQTSLTGYRYNPEGPARWPGFGRGRAPATGTLSLPAPIPVAASAGASATNTNEPWLPKGSEL